MVHLLLRFRRMFAWKKVHTSGCFDYFENTLTRERNAKWRGNCGSTALHRSWLTGGEWDSAHFPEDQA